MTNSIKEFKKLKDFFKGDIFEEFDLYEVNSYDNTVTEYKDCHLELHSSGLFFSDHEDGVLTSIDCLVAYEDSLNSNKLFLSKTKALEYQLKIAEDQLKFDLEMVDSQRKIIEELKK